MTTSQTTSYDELIAVIPDFPTEGVQFQDITPVLADAKAFQNVANDLAKHYGAHGITKVIGAEARGFIVGTAVALALNVGFVPSRKKGKLPRVGESATYDLEYGTDTLQIPEGAIDSSDTVLIVDDLLATGGTACAIAEMVKKSGAKLAGFAFFIELIDEDGRERIGKATGAEVFSLCRR